MTFNKNDFNFEFCDDYFIYLFENNVPFDREDIREFIEGWQYITKRDEFYDRWTRHITTICELNNHYYAVEWDAGLTEMQEDEFYCQPYEVFPEEEQRLITFTKWKNKENNLICETMNDE